MTVSRRAASLPVGVVVSVVPKMRLGAPKRNVAIGLWYLLFLWVVSARALVLFSI